MENILPFLLAVAALAFKIYDNFQKEQEKAKKRNPGAPPVNIPSPKPSTTVVRPEPKPVYAEKIPEGRYEPQYKPVYREPAPPPVYSEPKIERPKREVPLYRENINPEIPVEEVRRSRALHQAHKVHLKSPSEAEEERMFEFDVHDAVIKEAILNRPQY